jgi:hypothetical protein
VSNPDRAGRVVGADGRPAGEALVSVVWSTVAFPEAALATEADGTFALGLPPGRFRLQAHTADGRSGELETAGESDEELVIQVR